MPATTPKFLLPYPVDSDKLRELPTILYDQALAIESTLKGFDFNGQDKDGLASRVTSLERTASDLQLSSPRTASYSRNVSISLTAGAHTAIASLTPSQQSTDVLTYANNLFRFEYDCVANISVEARSGERFSSYNSDPRYFVELLLNLPTTSGITNAGEIGRTSFLYENYVTGGFSRYFSAGDTLLPDVMAGMSGRTLTSYIVNFSIQRIIND
ncbi:hypothetical protein [Bifidobacterium psychraerophilum]|uniref:hypothetical protein n=1 Tax=Bifidobacterium psychraerophilum TaxID=218140 RepID=UPI0033400831